MDTVCHVDVLRTRLSHCDKDTSRQSIHDIYEVSTRRLVGEEVPCGDSQSADKQSQQRQLFLAESHSSNYTSESDTSL